MKNILNIISRNNTSTKQTEQGILAFKIFLIVFITLAVVSRLLVWHFFWVAPEWGTDARAYQDISIRLVNSDCYGNYIGEADAWRPPGFAFICWTWYNTIELFNPGLVENQDPGLSSFGLMCALISALWILLLTLLARYIYNRSVACIIGTLLLLWPTYLLMGLDGLSELPCGVFWIASILMLTRRLRKPGHYIIHAYLAGILFGFSALIRLNPLLITPAMIMLIYFENKRQRKLLYISSLVFVIGMISIISPWSIRNYIVLDEFIPISSNGGEVFHSANAIMDFKKGGGYNPETYGILRNLEPLPGKRNALGYKKGIEAIIENPGIFIKSIPLRLKKAFYSDINIHPVLASKKACLTPLTSMISRNFIEIQTFFNSLWRLLLCIPFIVLARWHFYEGKNKYWIPVLLLQIFIAYSAVVPFLCQSRSHHPWSGALFLLLPLAILPSRLLNTPMPSEGE